MLLEQLPEMFILQLRTWASAVLNQQGEEIALLLNSNLPYPL